MQYQPQAAIPDVVSDTVGLFAEWTRTLRRGLTLSAGARLDHVRSQADEARANTDLSFAYHDTRDTTWSATLPSGKLRLAWKGAGGVELAATLGHAARAPEADERFFALKRMGTDWVGQPDLDPARNTGVDVSASWQRQGLFVSASLFANRVDGYIAVVPAARVNMVPGVMNTSARTWANVDATLRGGELAAVVPLAGRLFLSGDLSYVRGTKDTNPAAGITDADLAEMPPLRVRTALRFDDGRFYAVAEGVFCASQRRVDSALKEEPTGGWGVANVLAGFRQRRLVVTVGVSNLFDRRYVEHLSYQRDPYRSGVRVPEPGRSFFTNASFRF
jgi:iron complex outermembrane receptor protein